MTPEQYSAKLAALEHAFVEYANRFLYGDRQFNRNIELKREHSLRVRRECAEIVRTLEFLPHDRFIAEVAGLLHDLGRFEQYARHRTFVDLKSEDHGQLGLAALEQLTWLNDFEETDLARIRTAIASHNRRTIPENIAGVELLTARAVRDADKLDIMHIVLDYYRHPETNDTITLELEDSPAISPQVIQLISRKESVSLRDLRTVTDFKMAQLGWVYDLNFRRSFQLYLERGYHRELRRHLPDTPDVDRIFEIIDCHVLERAAR